MKDDKEMKKCNILCWPHRSKVVGAVFILLAAVLTLLTLNGFGILGMFIVGYMLCKKSTCGCGCGCGCGCSCHKECSDHQSCCDVDPIKTTTKKTMDKKTKQDI